MRAVVQRVLVASVSVKAEVIAKIEQGLVALVGVCAGDSEQDAKWLAERLAGLRVFEDEQGKMNLSAREIGASLLLVPNFTVCAKVGKGRRPSFDSAASYEEGKRLFDLLLGLCQSWNVPIQCGQYGAEMKVSLVNDGPVTLLLESPR